MKTKHTSTNVKPQYVSRNLYDRTRQARETLAQRCARQERRLAHLNARVIALTELAAATGALNFHREQDPAAVRRYNLARRAVQP